MGRLIAEAHSIGLTAPPPVTYNTGYTYSLDGSPQTLTYPSGDVVTYTVGGAGRAIQLNDSSNNYVGYSGSTATSCAARRASQDDKRVHEFSLGHRDLEQL